MKIMYRKKRSWCPYLRWNQKSSMTDIAFYFEQSWHASKMMNSISWVELKAAWSSKLWSIWTISFVSMKWNPESICFGILPVPVYNNCCQCDTKTPFFVWWHYLTLSTNFIGLNAHTKAPQHPSYRYESPHFIFLCVFSGDWLKRNLNWWTIPPVSF